jgi:pimeloyl-ACP methyl ester carboxylesterase
MSGPASAGNQAMIENSAAGRVGTADEVAAGLEEREGGWWPRFDRDVMVRSLAEDAQRSFRHEWGQVACPTLVVLAQSSFIPAQEADEMLRQQPATMSMSIPGTSHDLHLEQPETLHSTLSDFLQGLA